MAEKKVLVVEDEAIVAMSLQDTLKKMGYTVVGIAYTGPDAIQKASETLPDVILMDIHLKGTMDGIEATEKINAMYDIPVIYLTAFSDDETIQRAMKTQSHSYLVKPINPRELYTNIEFAIYKQRVKGRTGSELENLQLTLTKIADTAIVMDLKGTIRYANPAAEALTGWKRDEIVGKNAFYLLGLTRSQNDQFNEITLQKIQNLEGVHYIPDVATLTTKGDRKKTVTLRTGVISEKDNAILGILVLIREYMAGLAPGPEPAPASGDLQAVADAISDPMFAVDRNTNIIMSNAGFHRFMKTLGISPDLLSRPLNEMGHVIFSDAYPDYRDLFATGIPTTKVKAYTIQNNEMFLEIRKIPVVKENKVVQILTFLRDRTLEERTKQKNLLMHNKIEKIKRKAEESRGNYQEMTLALQNIIKVSSEGTDPLSQHLTRTTARIIDLIRSMALESLEYEQVLDALQRDNYDIIKNLV